MLDPDRSRETVDVFLKAADAVGGDAGTALDLFLLDRGVSDEDRDGVVAGWLAGTARDVGPLVALAPEAGARALLAGAFMLGFQSAEQVYGRAGG